MSNFMKNARTWLGLGNDPYYDDEYGDPEYDDYDDGDVPEDAGAEDAPAPRPAARPAAARPLPAEGASRASATPGPCPVAPATGTRATEACGSSPLRHPPPPSPRTVVWCVRSRRRPSRTSCHPPPSTTCRRSPTRFKRSQPVIVNLQGVDRDLSRRLIDFGSGLCYGLEGNMERVADQVFLLTPAGAQISDDDRRRIREGGLVGEDH